MTCQSMGLALLSFFCLASPAFADTITVSWSAIPTITIAPSNDTVSLSSRSTLAAGTGRIVFQGGDFVIGDSEIADQLIPFSFYDTITINGISKSVLISAQDNVTTTADVLTILAGVPVIFGSYVFTLDSSTYNGVSLGQDLPLSLSAEVTAAPATEPATLPLLGTGLLGGAVLMMTMRRRPLTYM